MTPATPQPRWSLQDISFDHIQKERIVHDQDWFYLLAGASFVESLADLYAHNLVAYYDDNPSAQRWLGREWEPEELQHGRALRAYVLAVWPDFDWEGAYAAFERAYRPLCADGLLGPTKALEMAARCVVETGTSSFYGMIQAASPEPVLRDLAARIRADEVHHYKYFYRYFREYQQHERLSRWRLLRELLRRIAEVDQEDSFLAIKAAYETHNRGQTFSRADFDAYRRRMGNWIQRYYPFEMAVKMLLKPMDLPRLLQRAAVPLLTRKARKVLAN